MHIKLDVFLFPWMQELKLFWKKLLVFHPSDCAPHPLLVADVAVNGAVVRLLSL